MINEVIEMTQQEKAMDDATDFMSKKQTKVEQEEFLQQVLFGLR